jgi:hypothetical protein
MNASLTMCSIRPARPARAVMARAEVINQSVMKDEAKVVTTIKAADISGKGAVNIHASCIRFVHQWSASVKR